jgi:hypothetical protein
MAATRERTYSVYSVSQYKRKKVQEKKEILGKKGRAG